MVHLMTEQLVGPARISGVFAPRCALFANFDHLDRIFCFGMLTQAHCFMPALLFYRGRLCVAFEPSMPKYLSDSGLEVRLTPCTLCTPGNHTSSSWRAYEMAGRR